MTVIDYRIKNEIGWNQDPNSRYLVYSKTAKDSLPITSTTVAIQPCMDPSQTFSKAGFYPSERGRGEVCNEGNDSIDQQYNLVGDSISVYNLQY